MLPLFRIQIPSAERNSPSTIYFQINNSIIFVTETYFSFCSTSPFLFRSFSAQIYRDVLASINYIGIRLLYTHNFRSLRQPRSKNFYYLSKHGKEKLYTRTFIVEPKIINDIFFVYRLRFHFPLTSVQTDKTDKIDVLIYVRIKL